MPQPTPYERQANFTDHEANYPGTPQPGADLDAEFNAIGETLGETLANLRKIQRDDGKLVNQSVAPETLNMDARRIMNGWVPKGAWATARGYAAKDVVGFNSATYVCVVAHAAGVFATDLAAGKWMAITDMPEDVEVTATGSAIARALKDRFADVVNVKDWGARGDGVADDTAAIQAAVDFGSANGKEVYFPIGDYKVTSPIVTGAKAISLRGCSPFATRLLCAHTGDLFQHGLASQVYFAAFAVQDIGLYCTVEGAGYAINIRQDYNSGTFRLLNVRFASFSSAFSWEGFVLAEGTTLTTMRDVQAEGGTYNDEANWPSGTQNGMLFRSNDNSRKAFVFQFDNCHISAIQHAVSFEVNGLPGNSGTLEGAVFRACGGRTNTGAWLRVAVPNSSTVWWPPYFVMDKCNMEGPGQLTDVDAASEFHMANCLHYVQEATDGATAQDFIRFGSVKQAYIHDNTLSLYAGALINDLISIGATSQNVTIRDNNFMVADNTVTLASGVRITPGAAECHLLNNRYLNWPAGKPKEWDGTNALSADVYDNNGGGVHLRSHGAISFRAVNFAAGNTAYGQVVGGTNAVVFSAEGANASVDAVLDAKGSGSVYLRANGGRLALQTLASGAAVNWPKIVGTSSTFGPQYSVDGSDANIDVRIEPKGSSGRVRFGSWVSSADAAINGYIEIKESNGSVRKLATIS